MGVFAAFRTDWSSFRMPVARCWALLATNPDSGSNGAEVVSGQPVRGHFIKLVVCDT